jgi:hypothetical protein
MLVTCSVFVLKIDRFFLAMTTTTIPSVGMEFNSVRTISTKERKTTPLDHASLFVARKVIGCWTRDLI